MKLIGVFFITIGCSGCGFYMAYRLMERLKQLKQLYQFLSMLQGEIRYQNAVLQEAFLSMIGRVEGWQRKFLAGLMEKLMAQHTKTFEQLWGEEVRKLLNDTSLCEEDIKLLLELGGQIGYLDKEMQLTTIEFYKKYLVDTIEELERQKMERCRLYRVLGISSGMLAALVLF